MTTMSNCAAHEAAQACKPKFTVCIPTYNMGSLLPMAVHSVLAQTFVDFEILVGDNCSTDNTVRELEKLQDVRIRKFTNAQNIGMYANINRLVLEARGEWIKILCADDELAPDCLEIISKYTESYDMIAHNATSEKFKLMACRESYRLYAYSREGFLASINLGAYRTALVNVAVKKTLLENLDWYRSSGTMGDFSVDCVTALRAFAQSGGLYIDLHLAFARIHGAQNSHTMGIHKQYYEYDALFREFLSKDHPPRRQRDEMSKFLDYNYAAIILSALKHMFLRGNLDRAKQAYLIYKFRGSGGFPLSSVVIRIFRSALQGLRVSRL